MEMDVAVATKINDIHQNQKRQDTQRKHGGRPVFGIDDTVWVQKPSAMGMDKTGSRWIGPCKVLQRLGEHVYRVQVAPKRHRDVHVVNLKPHVPPLIGPSWPLFHRPEVQPQNSNVDEWNVEPIVRHRLRNGELEFLVRKVWPRR